MEQFFVPLFKNGLVIEIVVSYPLTGGKLMIWTILFVILAVITVVMFAFLLLKGKGLEAAMKMLIANAEILDELAKKTPNKLDDKLMAMVRKVLGLPEVKPEPEDDKE